MASKDGLSALLDPGPSAGDSGQRENPRVPLWSSREKGLEEHSFSQILSTLAYTDLSTVP